MKILICGFMGAGKSSFLKKFEPNDLAFQVIDLDHALAQDAGVSPQQLGEWIEQNGFPFFREKEKTKITNLLLDPRPMVIALGAGSLNSEIFSLIKRLPEVKLVFLNTPLDECLKRIKLDSNRPLAKLPENELRELYQKRLSDYEKADLIITQEKINEIVSLSSLAQLVHNLDNSSYRGKK